jgi:hypothetical protein
MHLNQNPSDEEILRFVEAWIDDLVRGDYMAAFRRTAHGSYHQWTPDLIWAVIQGYGLPDPHHSGQVFIVTPRALALGGPPQRIVERDVVRPPVWAEVWHDLPINGQWSDLTATFRVEPRDGSSVVILQEIHVF